MPCPCEGVWDCLSASEVFPLQPLPGGLELLQGGSHAAPWQARYCFSPWERLYHGTRRNSILLVKVPEQVYNGGSSLSSGWKQSHMTTGGNTCLEFLRMV